MHKRSLDPSWLLSLNMQVTFILSSVWIYHDIWPHVCENENSREFFAHKQRSLVAQRVWNAEPTFAHCARWACQHQRPSRSRGTTLGAVSRSANVPIFIHAFNSRRRAWAVSFPAGLHQCLTFILGEDTDWPCLCLSIHGNLRCPPPKLPPPINPMVNSPLIRPY